MRVEFVIVSVLSFTCAVIASQETAAQRGEETRGHHGDTGVLGDEVWASTVGMAHALLKECLPEAAAHLLAKHGISKHALRHLISCGNHEHAKELAWHSGADVEYQLAKELSKGLQRRVPAKNPAEMAASWHSFGKASACRLDEDDVSMDGMRSAQHMNASSLAECQDLCVKATSCTGVEHEKSTGYCRLWTMPIGFIRSHRGWECLALTRQRTDSVVKGFQPVFKHSMPSEKHPAYTDVGHGKCLAGNKDPVFSYFSGNGDQCRQMCDESTACYGYSVSVYSNCLLWEESQLVKGGDEWGSAHCFIKNAKGVQRSTTTFVVQINPRSYVAAKGNCRSQGLAIASLHGEQEEDVVRRLIAEAGVERAFVEQDGIGRLLWARTSLPEQSQGSRDQEKLEASVCELCKWDCRLNPQVFRFV